jgi:hypothetical protein
MFPKWAPRWSEQVSLQPGDLGTSEQIDAQFDLKVPQKSAEFVKKIRNHEAQNPNQFTVSLRILMDFWAFQTGEMGSAA